METHYKKTQVPNDVTFSWANNKMNKDQQRSQWRPEEKNMG